MAKPEDRHAYISRLCEQAGGKLLSFYFTLGRYDFLLVMDMPNAQGPHAACSSGLGRWWHRGYGDHAGFQHG
jgi:uncharacterized protein with GYD domain